jgi:hypothetical protein
MLADNGHDTAPRDLTQRSYVKAPEKELKVLILVGDNNGHAVPQYRFGQRRVIVDYEAD